MWLGDYAEMRFDSGETRFYLSQKIIYDTQWFNVEI